MVLLSCALDMMLLWVSTIISLELMVLSFGLRVPLEPFNDPVTPKVDSIFDLAITLDIYAVSRFYFEFDVAVGQIRMRFRHNASMSLICYGSWALSLG